MLVNSDIDPDFRKAMVGVTLNMAGLKAQQAQRDGQDGPDLGPLEREMELRREAEAKVRGRAPLSLEELDTRARQVVQSQLEHKDKRIRREAARLALDITRGRLSDKEKDDVTEVVYVSRAYTDADEKTVAAT